MDRAGGVDSATMTESPFATDAVPAATVMLLRDVPSHDPAGRDLTQLEVLMLRRNANLAFAGGAWVFPGGRVDREDVDPARPADELATARNAAAREAREEAGLELDPASFVVLSRWCPPPQAPRRFDTWFFVAAATPLAEVTIDGGEIHDHLWITPHEAMARRVAGEVEMIPPTWVSLLSVSNFLTVATALAAIAGRVPDEFVTRMVQGASGARALLWAGDAGYLEGRLDQSGSRHRLWLDESDWRYERDFDSVA